MKIFPAIDIINGNCVRLTQGDYGQEKKYTLTPLQAALEHQAQGASYLHVVDLDAARTGKAQNARTITEIAEKTDLTIQVGGGIRNLDIIDTYLSSGVSRVIVGTNAITDRAFFLAALHSFPAQVALGLDVFEDYIYINGWKEKTPYTIDDFLSNIDYSLLSALIVTDIAKDGMMQGTNLQLIRRLMQRYDLPIIASGGVSTMADIKALCDMDVYGAIIGKALYENQLTLKEILSYIKTKGKEQ